MIIYGKQVVLYAICCYAKDIKEFYVAKTLEKAIFRKISALKKPILRIDIKKAQALAKNGNHQGIFANIAPLTPTPLNQLKKLNRIVVLCGISDVGNIGGIVRSAYCLGVEAIIISQINNPKIDSIIRASAGAMLSLPFGVEDNPLDVLNELKNESFACYGAGMEGEDIASFIPKKKWAVFLGNESSGLVSKISKKLDTIIAIRMYNCFDSLNVSVAAGIIMSYLDSNARQKT